MFLIDLTLAVRKRYHDRDPSVELLYLSFHGRFIRKAEPAAIRVRTAMSEGRCMLRSSGVFDVPLHPYIRLKFAEIDPENVRNYDRAEVQIEKMLDVVEGVDPLGFETFLTVHDVSFD